MTQPSDQQTVWLTQEAYDKLQAELDHLRGPMREEIIERIASSREEGDLRENGGYHAAREEQGKADARIKQIVDILSRARVGETPPDDGVVEPGKLVTIRFEGDTETETFLLGAREILDVSEGMQVYSPQSPLGKAILGATRGVTVPFAAPNGKQLKVDVVDVVPFEG